jgi:hypothetical protein
LVIEESKPFVGDIEVDQSYFGPRRVRGKRGEERPVKSLFWACINDKEGCF